MGLTVYGGGGKPEEEKTVIAGTSAIVVNPSSGKVMKKVTVNPTPTESKSVTPTTSELTVTPSEGKHLSQVVVGAVEDVTPEVTAQTPVISQIAENLGVTITTPSGTNKQILHGNNANLLNIKDNAKKEGVYVWKKLTAEGGDFVDFVVSDNASAYPDGGEQGGYWYERVKEGIDPTLFGCTKYVVDKFTLSTITYWHESNLVHSLGEIPKVFFLIGNLTASYKTNDVESIIGFNKTQTVTNAGSAIGAGGIKRSNNQEKNIADIAFYTPNISNIHGHRTSTNGNVYLETGIEYTLITMA